MINKCHSGGGERKGSKRGSRKSGLVFIKLMMYCLVCTAQSIYLKSCSLGLFQSSGGLSFFDQGLSELINRESSLDQRTAGQT